MNEIAGYGLEILLGFIVVPWCVWVSASIFTMRQELAVMRALSKYIQNHSPGASQ